MLGRYFLLLDARPSKRVLASMELTLSKAVNEIRRSSRDDSVLLFYLFPGLRAEILSTRRIDISGLCVSSLRQ